MLDTQFDQTLIVSGTNIKALNIDFKGPFSLFSGIVWFFLGVFLLYKT